MKRPFGFIVLKMHLSFSSDQVLEERIENRIGGRGDCLEVHFVCHSFKTIPITDKDAQTKFFWGPVGCMYMDEKRSNIVGEALFSSPGSVIFGPLGICELVALEMS